MNKKVIVIAEAGVNHNGSLERAFAMVEAAKMAGADYVKFQTFNSAQLVTKNAEQAKYQVENIGEETSQLQMLQNLELSHENHHKLKAHCEKIGINFFSTAFDFTSVDFLHELGLKLWKVPSGELTNLPYLEKIASFGAPMILSTGMATLEEIGETLAALKKMNYSLDQICVLHCTTDYPAQMQDINLLAMKTIAEKYNVKIGYSDHSLGIEVAIAAVALGAQVIEKHFTLDRDLPGPDHKASLLPEELKAMISSIRNIEIALGTSEKMPSKIELQNRLVVRKSIVAISPIKRGEVFTTNNIGTKRPGTGISPMKWHEVLGKIADKDYMQDDLI